MLVAGRLCLGVPIGEPAMFYFPKRDDLCACSPIGFSSVGADQLSWRCFFLLKPRSFFIIETIPGEGNITPGTTRPRGVTSA